MSQKTSQGISPPMQCLHDRGIDSSCTCLFHHSKGAKHKAKGSLICIRHHLYDSEEKISTTTCTLCCCNEKWLVHSWWCVVPVTPHLCRQHFNPIQSDYSGQCSTEYWGTFPARERKGLDATHFLFRSTEFMRKASQIIGSPIWDGNPISWMETFCQGFFYTTCSKKEKKKVECKEWAIPGSLGFFGYFKSQHLTFYIKGYKGP